MKLELATAKISKGAAGTWRSLRVGEAIQEGDIVFGLTFVCDVSQKNIGDLVKKGESIIRLEFEK